ncbi:hypothetical protein phi1422_0041 [Bdellovibrio phage phi1422]|uniref:hypothetical protein n=1 Tax=Bdellovibrio phage phi1422 TaxID=1127515 RepID=UPI0002536D5D|nr:hypothetical protein F395_gp41 [Bdellovibrio phage phi1422]AFC22561.1 hypothetical protein phi1422_0041 [Bdellovibrio phage phi1422]
MITNKIEIMKKEVKDFVTKENYCPLCDSGLILYIMKCDCCENKIEIASCKKCEVVTRTREHKVH